MLLTKMCFAEQLKPEQVVDLLWAAKQQYKAIDVDYEKEGYSNINNNMELNYKGNITYRSTLDKVYYSQDGQHFLHGEKSDPIKRANKIAVCSKYSKKLAWGDDVTGHEGQVTHDNLEGNMLGSPLKFLFEIFESETPESLKSKVINIDTDNNGNYVVKVQRFKNRKYYVNITINPKYNFVPSKYEFTHENKVSYKSEFGDFKEVSPGIWLPFVYNYDHPGEATGKLIIKKARVNVNLDKSDLDFEFPSGTYVIDRIANIEYTVGEGMDDTDGLGDALADINNSTSSDLERNLDFKTNEISVDDQQLKSSYEKSKKIFESDKPEDENSLNTSDPSKTLYIVISIIFLFFVVIVAVLIRKKRM